jgi:hypothetical protein
MSFEGERLVGELPTVHYGLTPDSFRAVWPR